MYDTYTYVHASLFRCSTLIRNRPHSPLQYAYTHTYIRTYIRLRNTCMWYFQGARYSSNTPAQPTTIYIHTQEDTVTYTYMACAYTYIYTYTYI